MGMMRPWWHVIVFDDDVVAAAGRMSDDDENCGGDAGHCSWINAAEETGLLQQLGQPIQKSKVDSLITRRITNWSPVLLKVWPAC